MRQTISELTDEPILAWIWIDGHGWIDGAINNTGLLFDRRPPDIAIGSHVFAVERTEGEPPPTEEEAAEIIADIEREAKAQWN
jgi:hypothetical protein